MSGAWIDNDLVVIGEDKELYLRLKAEGRVYWYDQKILVSGIGRSGTNLFTEVVRASDAFNFTGFVEDRYSWNGYAEGLIPLISENYGTKMACQAPYWLLQSFSNNMVRFPGMHALFALRHPIDVALSEFRRNVNPANGGESTDITPAQFEEQIRPERADEIVKLWNDDYIINLITVHERFKDTGRVQFYKVEDLLLSPERVAKEIAQWLDIEYNEQMAQPWGKVRHRYQKERYGGKQDTSRISVYKRWRTAYDTFYEDKEDIVMKFVDGLRDVAKVLGYEVEL